MTPDDAVTTPEVVLDLGKPVTLNVVEFREYLPLGQRVDAFRWTPNEAQLQQALEQIENLCRAMQGLRADIFPKNPRNFAILAEGPLDEIRKLQALVDEYVTRLEQVGAA
jgi:hypothetical protein